MSIENALSKQLGILSTLGKTGLNVSFPKEFELYLCALELTDENYNTLQYFVFPVMPTNIDETQQFTSNIRRTLGGVTVLSTPTFTPRDITLTGTFGRKFRVLLGRNYTEFITSFKTVGDKTVFQSAWDGVVQVFDDRVKTGFGCLKIMEEIVNTVNRVDKKGIRHLILHNPAIGNSYLIKPQSLKLSQTQETNMLWSYSLSLKAIASLEHIMESEKLLEQRLRLNTTGYIQKGVDNVVDAITQMLG